MVRVSVQKVEQGVWRPKRDELESSAGLGLLVLDGFAARWLALGERWCAELLRQGCLLQPRLADGEFAVSPLEARLTVLERMNVAVLDSGVLETICRWPDIVRNLVSARANAWGTWPATSRRPASISACTSNSGTSPNASDA